MIKKWKYKEIKQFMNYVLGSMHGRALCARKHARTWETSTETAHPYKVEYENIIS